MTNQLTIYQGDTFDTMQRVAKALADSKFFEADFAKAITKVMAGQELGLPPFASMSGIHIIQGKPVMGANLIATLIDTHPLYEYRVTSMTDELVSIDFYKRGDKIGTSSFSMADARKAQTKNLDKFPRNMLFARAISNGARWYCPAIFGGSPVYTPDEMGLSVNEDGYIDGEILEHQPQQVTASPDFSAPAAKGRRTGQPMESPALRDYMANKAHGSTSAPSDKQLVYMRSSLSKAAGTPQKAKQVQAYLFGVDSSTFLTSGQVSAIIDWLGATADNEYTADPVSLQELERVCTAYLREQGQADLFPAPTPPPAPEQGTAGDVDGVAPLLDGVHYQALLAKTDPNVGDVIAALNGDNVTTPPIARGIIEQLYAEIKPTPAKKLKPETAATMYEAVVIHLGDTVA